MQVFYKRCHAFFDMASQKSTVVVFLLILAFIVRFIALGNAVLWGDELYFIHFGTQPLTLKPWEVFFHYYNNNMTAPHLPVAALMHNLYLQVVSHFADDWMHNAFIHRLPGIMLGSVAVVWFYVLCLRIVRPVVAFCAGLFMAMMFLPVYYAREVCSYPTLVFFSVGACERFFFLMQPETVVSKRQAIILGVLWMALVFSHLYGIILLVAMLSCVVLRMVYEWFVYPKRTISPAAIYLLIAGAGALALVFPFAYGIINQYGGVTRVGPPIGYVAILTNIFSKCLLGTSAVWKQGLAWILLLAGGVELFIQIREKASLLWVLVVLVVSLLPIAYLCYLSQYYVRYFALLFPLIYLFFALGILRIVTIITKRMDEISWQPYLCVGGTVMLIIGNAVQFYGPMYSMRSKAINYLAIDTWLNQNIQDGSCYMINSQYGWDTRLLPGILHTPGKTPILFYSSDEDSREKQKRLIMDLSIPVYIESVIDSWDWLPSFYQHCKEFSDPSIHTLMQRGMGVQDVSPEYDTGMRRLWYNTADEMREMLRKQGQKVSYTSENFELGLVPPGIYARVSPSAFSSIYIENLTERPLNGHIRIEGMVFADQPQCPLEILIENKVADTLTVGNEQSWSIDLTNATIGPAGMTLGFRLPQQPAMLVILGIRPEWAPK